jgi:hypothetical protein
VHFWRLEFSDVLYMSGTFCINLYHVMYFNEGYKVLRHFVQTTGQVHAPAALLPRTEPSVRSYDGRKVHMKFSGLTAVPQRSL